MQNASMGTEKLEIQFKIWPDVNHDMNIHNTYRWAWVPQEIFSDLYL